MQNIYTPIRKPPFKRLCNIMTFSNKGTKTIHRDQQQMNKYPMQ